MNVRREKASVFESLMARGIKSLALDTPETRACRECGKEFVTSQMLQRVCNGCVELYRNHAHPSQQRQADYEWDCRLRDAGLEPEDQIARAMTFAHAVRDWQPAAYDAARAFVDGWPETRALALLGDVGSGKTHLAIAILQEMLRARESCFYRHVPRMKYELSIALDYQQASQILTKPLLKAGLVVLDDFGRASFTANEQSWLDALIDARWRGGYPTIFTANLQWPDFVTAMGKAGISRFADGGAVVTLESKDLRRIRR